MSAAPILPFALGYLQPVVDRLAELPDDEINEDLDTAFIDQAVRDRFADTDQASAEELFEEHYELLKSLCGELADEKGILAYLEGYLAVFVFEPELLKSPPEPPPKSGRRVVLDGSPASGFTTEQPHDIQLVLKRGDLTIVVLSLDDLGFKSLSLNRDRWSMPPGSGCVFDRRVEPVQFGLASGTRELYQQSSPASWMQVSYLLTVPGGRVNVQAFAGSKENKDFGKKFDLADVEAILPSIRVVAED